MSPRTQQLLSTSSWTGADFVLSAECSTSSPTVVTAAGPLHQVSALYIMLQTRRMH